MGSALKIKSMNSDSSLISNSKIFNALNSSRSVIMERVEENDDIFPQFRGLLILGRILGLIPVSGVFRRSHKDLKYSICSLAGIGSICCISLLALNVTLAVINAVKDKKRSPLDIARSIQGPLFCSWGLFIYVYFFARVQNFIKIFKSWSNLNLFYTEKDSTLFRTIVVVSVLLFISCVLENAVLHMEFFVVFDGINGHNAKYGKETGNATVYQMYYYRAHSYWNRTIGYHPIWVLITFLTHKWVLYGWNYVDVIMGLFCRALYFKFKALCKAAEDSLVQPVTPLETLDIYIPTDSDRQAWNQLARDHDALCELMNAMNRFFSPIIFVSYTVNIYFFCMQLLGSLNPEIVSDSLVHSIYAPWSFIHIVLRIFILSIFAARVNVYAHSVRDVVQRCPLELYDGPIAKLDKRVNNGPKLGITGLGCFVITKPFMLSILNVVFTIEIVLLQGLSSSQTTAPSNCSLPTKT